MNGTVTSVEPQEGNEFFKVAIKGNDTVTARKVVLGTGLRDLVPNTPGVQENWGKGIYWCPWCDGHEHADQTLGILGSLNKVANATQEILTLDQDVIAFVNGTDTPENRKLADDSFPQWEKYLKIHNITIYNQTIEEIVHDKDGVEKDANPALPTVAEHDVFHVKLDDGKTVEANAFFANFDTEQRSDIGKEAGIDIIWGYRMFANMTQGYTSNIPGLFVIGDANSDNSTNVPHALFTGKRAAVFLHGKNSTNDIAQQSLTI